MKRLISLSIENSSFFDEVLIIEFNNALNCLMGGRGTGKSTLLHFIKACISYNEDQDKLTQSIIRNNLGDGLIKLVFESSTGVNYRIEKSQDDDPQVYVDNTNEFVPFENIIHELRIDIFPAQSIEEIGRSANARLALIDKMLEGKIEREQVSEEELVTSLEKNAKDIRSENRKLIQLEDTLKEFSSVESDLAAHISDAPTDINQAENEEFNKEDIAQKLRNVESRFLKGLISKTSSMKSSLSAFIEEVEDVLLYSKSDRSFHNTTKLSEINSMATGILNELKAQNTSSVSKLDQLEAQLNNHERELSTIHEAQNNNFIQLKQRLDRHKKYYEKLNALGQRSEQRKVIIGDINETTKKRNKLKNKRSLLLKDLLKSRNNIFKLRLNKVEELNRLFGDSVRITLTPSGVLDSYEDALRNALKGQNMRYNTLIPHIVKNFTPDKLASIIHDSDTERLKQISGIDIERSQQIVNALHESDAIYTIETLYCQDLPDFHLKVESNMGNKSEETVYKKSDELSTGQRCTTVLPVVFSISSNPLLIDQPEDNLDNKYISDTIHKIIKEKKKNRQLVFITHNANIPVLSEAEANYFLKYEDGHSTVDAKGDINNVQNNIINLLEGGKNAFETRKNLYGY